MTGNAHRVIWPLLTALSLFASRAGKAQERAIPPAFGSYLNPAESDFAGAKSFTANDRIVGTYYFYWYDIYSQSHIINPENGSDGLTTHPATLEDFSYKSVAWHKKQLTDMEAAGINVALMVFWGSPAEHEPGTELHWSFAGLPPLVQARDELTRAGHHPPRIGLFYDTSTLQHNAWHYHADLTTDYGRKWFYATVRDFFSCIPARHWAMIDAKPVILMYAAAFAKKWDQSFLEYAKTEFPKEFSGRVPWIAPQDSWRVKGDDTCAWGGALGFKNPGIGEIGPGYDHAHVYGRTPLVKEREAGKFYETSWLKFLRRPTHFVMIETWNEFHEGTDIAESRESGRKYIKLTAKYSKYFKQGWKPPAPTGPFSAARTLSGEPGPGDSPAGLTRCAAEDGNATVTELAGRKAWAGKPFTPGGSIYIYFAAAESFKTGDTMNTALEVDYFDAAPGHLGVEYDGSDANAPFAGAYTSANQIELKGDKKWKHARFKLPASRFLNSQNAGADFRLVAEAAEFGLGKLSLSKE